MTPRRTLKIFNERPVKRRNTPLFFLSILLLSIQFLPSVKFSLSLSQILAPYIFFSFLDIPVSSLSTRSSFSRFSCNLLFIPHPFNCFVRMQKWLLRIMALWMYSICFRRNLPCFEETFLGLIYRDVINKPLSEPEQLRNDTKKVFFVFSVHLTIPT